MAHPQSATSPAVDPARKSTLGLILIMMLWLGYCYYMAYEQQQREREAAEQQTDEADDPRERPEPTDEDVPATPADPDEADRADEPPDVGIDLPEPSAPDEHETDEPADPVTQTQPGDDAPAMAEAPRDGPAVRVTAPTYEAVVGSRIAGPPTEHIEPYFSEYGASMSDLYVLGYQALSARDHGRRGNVTENMHLLRPYDPRQLHYTADITFPGLPRNYLAHVRWEYVGTESQDLGDEEREPVRSVVGEAKAPPQKRHAVTFRYPPADATDVPAAWPSGLTIYKTFSYSDVSYLFDIGYRFENLSGRPIRVPQWRLNGPMGMQTSFFKPIETDILFIRRADATPQLVMKRSARDRADSDAMGQAYREMALGAFFPRGFEISDRAAYDWVKVELPRHDESAVSWIGHTVRFMATATFAPEGVPLTDEEAEAQAAELLPGETPPALWAPRVVEAIVVPFRNPTRAAIPEAEDEEGVAGRPLWQRWLLATTFTVAGFDVPAGGTRAFSVRSFAGPTEPAHMEAAGLGEAVHYSYSWVEWLAIPLIAILEFFHGIVGNWGVAIIMLTLLVRFVLFPVSYKSQYKMQEGAVLMQRIKPKLDKLRKKHEGDRQKMQAEQMKLFREEGVPMTGMLQGCLLMLLQMPIWIALFGAFRYYIGFYGADFLWIGDLTAPDALLTIGEFRLPYLPLLEAFGLLGGQMTPSGVFHLNILPIAVMLTMWYQMRYAQKQQSLAMDPDQVKQQRFMMGCMFIFFFFLFYSMPAGFNLYFLASTGYALIETRILKPRIKEQIEKRHPGIYKQIEADQAKAQRERELEQKRLQTRAARG